MYERNRMGKIQPNLVSKMLASHSLCHLREDGVAVAGMFYDCLTSHSYEAYVEVADSGLECGRSKGSALGVKHTYIMCACVAERCVAVLGHLVQDDREAN